MKTDSKSYTIVEKYFSFPIIVQIFFSEMYLRRFLNLMCKWFISVLKKKKKYYYLQS